MLFFLWGVFRARKVHFADSSKLHIPSFSMTSVEKYAPDNLCSPKCMDEESCACDKSCRADLSSNARDRACAGISGDCNDQKVSESMCLGSKANSIARDGRGDFKCTSNVSLCGKVRCSSLSFLTFVSFTILYSIIAHINLHCLMKMIQDSSC